MLFRKRMIQRKNSLAAHKIVPVFLPIPFHLLTEWGGGGDLSKNLLWSGGEKGWTIFLLRGGKTGPNNNPSACPLRECSSSTLSLFSPLFIWLCPFFTLLFLYDPFSSSPPFLPSLFSSSSYRSSHSIPNLLCLLLCLILLFSSVFLLCLSF